MVPKATKILRPGRACVLCSKSKTKCDGDRPCRKCMLRGMSDKCSDRREPGELSPRRPVGPRSAVAAQGRATAALGVSCVPQGTQVKVAPPEHTILDDRKFEGAVAMSGVANEADGPFGGTYAFPQAPRQIDSASALFVTPDLTLPLDQSRISVSHAGFSLVGRESKDVYGRYGSRATPTPSWNGSSTASMDLSQPICDDDALPTTPSHVAW